MIWLPIAEIPVPNQRRRKSRDSRSGRMSTAIRANRPRSGGSGRPLSTKEGLAERCSVAVCDGRSEATTQGARISVYGGVCGRRLGPSSVLLRLSRRFVEPSYS